MNGPHRSHAKSRSSTVVPSLLALPDAMSLSVRPLGFLHTSIMSVHAFVERSRPAAGQVWEQRVVVSVSEMSPQSVDQPHDGLLDPNAQPGHAPGRSVHDRAFEGDTLALAEAKASGLLGGDQEPVTAALDPAQAVAEPSPLRRCRARSGPSQ